MSSSRPDIAFIGFGEAAQAFTSGFRQEGPLVIRAFDVKTNGPQEDDKRKDYELSGVEGVDDCTDVCKNADLIFSLVTADQAGAAAREAAKTDLEGSLFLDCNSCAPDTKRASARLIEAAGGQYIDAAIMTPVHPRLHRSPVLLSGPNAVNASKITRSIGMMTETVNTEVGAASVRKMVRSVMVKGLEALTLECFLAGRKAGIEEEVLASLEKSYPGFGWADRVSYMLERMITHGNRRADEMQEVVQTLRDLGISPHMSEATTTRQREVGMLNLDAQSIGSKDIGAMTDTILTSLVKS